MLLAPVLVVVFKIDLAFIFVCLSVCLSVTQVNQSLLYKNY